MSFFYFIIELVKTQSCDILNLADNANQSSLLLLTIYMFFKIMALMLIVIVSTSMFIIPIALFLLFLKKTINIFFKKTL